MVDPALMTAALDVREVFFTYPGRRGTPPRPALTGVSTTLERGETVALLGANGSGKSTLMMLIAGLLSSERGEVAVHGDTDVAARRRHLGVVFQHTALDPLFTVAENLRDQATLAGLDRDAARAAITRELAAAEIHDRADDRVGVLSGGLRRRADLARVLLGQPSVLLLDEPTAGLDPAARTAFRRHLFARSAADAMTVLTTTHDIEEAEAHDRVLVMDDGRIVADDTPAALRASLGARRITVSDRTWSPPDSAWHHVLGVWVRDVPEDGEGGAAKIVTPLARAGVPFAVAPPTLADVFTERTGRSLTAEEDAA